MGKKHVQQLYLTFTAVFLAVFLVMGFWLLNSGIQNLNGADQFVGGAIVVLVAIALYAYSHDVVKWK